MTRLVVFLSLVFLANTSGASPVIPVPVATDSRIKTLVFNENDVFTILTHYGYQCNIEFGIGEEVQTVSLGDRVGWQVVPAGRRLFLRAMEDSSRTNMTVVTNRRTYQFDLKSAPLTQSPEEELVYVVRFFYPDEQKERISPPPYSDDATASVPSYVSSPALPPILPLPPVAAPAPALPSAGMTSAKNYGYTYTGPEAAAPLELFDDGKATYFKFPASQTSAPSIARVDADGKETLLKPGVSGGYVIVEGVAARYTVRFGQNTVYIYNEHYNR